MDLQAGSEVQRILAQIGQEYEAAMNGLSGLAQGTSRHHFITTRMENMGRLQEELEKLIGDQAIEMITLKLEAAPTNAGIINSPG